MFAGDRQEVSAKLKAETAARQKKARKTAAVDLESFPTCPDSAPVLVPKTGQSFRQPARVSPFVGSAFARRGRRTSQLAVHRREWREKISERRAHCRLFLYAGRQSGRTACDL